MTEQDRIDYIKLKEKRLDEYNVILLSNGYIPNAEVCPKCWDGSINGRECGFCEGSQIINEHILIKN